LNGNAVGDVQSGQQIRVIGTRNNDQTYTVDGSPVFDGIYTTTVSVLESLNYGTNEIVELPTSTNIKVLGDSYRFVMVGDVINVVSSTGNDGVYSVTGITQDDVYSVYSISPSLPSLVADGDIEFVERGGWIEPLRYQGIHMWYSDLIGIAIDENVDAEY